MRPARPEHTALDTAPGKTVPGRFLSFEKWLLEETNELDLLGQKGIVPVSADHLAVVGVHTRRANRFSQPPDGFCWKEPVGTDADEVQPGLDCAKNLFRRPASTQRIPGIHGAKNRQIGIGVEAIDE